MYTDSVLLYYDQHNVVCLSVARLHGTIHDFPPESTIPSFDVKEYNQCWWWVGLGFTLTVVLTVDSIHMAIISTGWLLGLWNRR